MDKKKINTIMKEKNCRLNSAIISRIFMCILGIVENYYSFIKILIAPYMQLIYFPQLLTNMLIT